MRIIFSWDKEMSKQIVKILDRWMSKRKREFISAWKMTFACVNLSISVDSGYKAVHEYHRI